MWKTGEKCWELVLSLHCGSRLSGLCSEFFYPLSVLLAQLAESQTLLSLLVLYLPLIILRLAVCHIPFLLSLACFIVPAQNIPDCSALALPRHLGGSKMGREWCSLELKFTTVRELLLFYGFSLFPDIECVPIILPLGLDQASCLIKDVGTTQREEAENSYHISSHHISLPLCLWLQMTDWLATALIWIPGPNLSHSHKDLSFQQSFSLRPMTAPHSQNTSRKGPS